MWLSESSFADFLRQGLETQAAYLSDPHPPEPREPLFIEDVGAFAAKDKGECIHCHSVFPALRTEALAQDEWGTDGDWLYPPPSRLGFDLDRDDQQSVTRELERVRVKPVREDDWPPNVEPDIPKTIKVTIEGPPAVVEAFSAESLEVYANLPSGHPSDASGSSGQFEIAYSFRDPVAARDVRVVKPAPGSKMQFTATVTPVQPPENGK